MAQRRNKRGEAEKQPGVKRIPHGSSLGNTKKAGKSGNHNGRDETNTNAANESVGDLVSDPVSHAGSCLVRGASLVRATPDWNKE